jgi:arginine repressor
MEWPEVMGTLAGENTIFVVSRTVAESKGVGGRLTTLTGLAVGDS